jgi:uncharacterized protein (DUF697 family)
MSRTLEVRLAGDADGVVERAKEAARKHGAEFVGDRFAGRFNGNGVEGHYAIRGDIATVTIDKKPDFAPWPLVESGIRGFFETSDPVEPPRGAKGSGPAADQGGAASEPSRLRRAQRIIKKHVLWSTGAGLIPIPVADLAAVTAVQVSMLEDLTRLYGVEYSESVLKGFITALTGGMAAQLGASAIKAIPGLGSLIGGVSMSVMSGASTYAVGQVARRQFHDAGDLRKVDMTAVRKEYKKEYEDGRSYVVSLEKGEAAAAPESASGDPDVLSRLERLAALRERGALTEEEFQEQKKKLLEEP